MKFVPVNTNRQKKSVYYLFLIIFYTDLFLALFPAWSGSFVYNYMSRTLFMNIWLLGALSIFLLSAILILCIQKKIYNLIIAFIIMILSVCFWTSIIINGFQSGGLALLGIPISYFVIFDTLKQYKFANLHLKVSFYSLLLWSISALVYYLIAPLDVKQQFFIGSEGQILTFSGFALHRNFYGILLGILILLLIVWKMKILYKISLFIVLLVCLWLSACRSAMVAVSVTSLFLIFFNKYISFRKKSFLFILLLLLAYALYTILSNPDLSLRDVSDNDDRKELWSGIYHIILKNFYWGIGKEAMYYSISFPEGAQAHNFILQVMANYGIFVCLSYLTLLGVIFYFSSYYFQAFLIYLMVFGLTQPYFGFMLPSVHIYLPLFIGHLLDNCKQKSTNENCILCF